MGEQEGWAEPNGLLPNGLLPNLGEETRVLDTERWLKAEERIAELIACIQPNEPSEERRNAVADYVQRLIMKCFPCQVFTFGSVPLKTYLPDGDIDLTAFSNNQTLKDTWAHQVRDMLENEEKNAQAEFRVKEVQYIQAEVKIIKCLVENIVVDISFNQLGGLCTLCFLEEVDHLINHNHLFKRSIILIKAWCYYESRILGAHHGLISTYALETLVLYIFHVFNNSFTGPLEVLYRFLEFFSKFDWDNFCVSLWGPVPISSLPDVTAEPPRKDGGNLLLSKLFLDACSTVYAVFPSGPENQSQPFLPKNFNVIDPLRVNNNLGRSVSKGNFYRIRSAFAFGAKRLARLLDCPKENLINEVNQFFKNTWERHGSGRRPDAPETDNRFTKSDNRGRKVNHFTYSQPNDVHGSNSRRNDVSTNSSTHVNANSVRASDHTAKESTSSNHVGYSDEGQRIKKSDHLVNNINGRFMFARTHSSPELGYMSTKVRRQRAVLPEGSSKSQTTSNNRKSNQPSPQGGVDVVNEELGTLGMNQEQQDLVNMMESTTLNHFNGQIPMPITIPPSFLASLGYTQRNLPGSLVPSMIPNMHFPHGFVPQPLGLELNPNLEYCSEPNNNNENFGWMEAGNGFWQDQDHHHVSESSSLEMLQSDEPLYDERSVSSRFSSSSHNNSLRSRAPEGSWDGSSAKVSKSSTRERRGTYGKGKTMPEHIDNYIEVDDHEGDEVPGYEVTAQSSSSEPTMMPGTQMYTGSGALARDNLVAFYPTGPPVPFITMLPVYDDIASESGGGAPDASLNFDLTEGVDHSEDLNINTSTISDDYKPDILNSDFASHFQNMQFGRFCQNPPNPGPMFYQTPLMIPPGYLQGRVPWDGPGRPHPTNFNLLTQLIGGGSSGDGGGGYGSSRGVGPPVAPMQSLPNRPLPNVYQRFADDIPKHRSGTGTYLPNPKVLAVRDRQQSNSRRVNYFYDRNDSSSSSSHGGDRDGNWNANSKARGGGGGGRGRGHNNNRNQTEKSNTRLDRFSSTSESRGVDNRSWTGGPYRNEPISSFTSQNGPTSFRTGPPNVAAFGPNNTSVPSVVMMYPFDHEQVEFGSISNHASSGHETTTAAAAAMPSRRSSPDQPSSPRRRHRRN